MNTDTRIERLVDASDELLTHLADEKGAEIQALRNRLIKTTQDIKRSLTIAAGRAGEQIKDSAVAVDDYVHESPWVAIGIAATVAALLGYAAGVVSARPRKFLGLF
jgi:ElaB/YqjD/DUF883 family membrane-anchored ribosome-binding protein